MPTRSSTRSTSRSTSRDVSRASSPPPDAIASAPRRAVRSEATTSASSKSPAPAGLDALFQLLQDDDLGAFVCSPGSPEADAENCDRQALSSPDGAPPTARKEIIPPGAQKQLMFLHHLLRSDEIDLQNLLSSNDAMLAEIIAPITL